MSIDHVDLIVEEPSMEVALRLLLPKMLHELSYNIFVHSCKSELLVRIKDRFRGYARYLPSNQRVIVLVDRDGDDCHHLKAKLDRWAKESGLTARTRNSKQYQVANRIVIEELEAWYFGDWQAVCAAYPNVSKTAQSKSAYRDPDAIRGGTWEALERVLQAAGYFPTGLSKRLVASKVAAHMDPSRNKSQSFCKFRDVMSELLTTS